MSIRLLVLVLFSVVASGAPALTYSTYLRNGFTPNAIATDSAGNIYMAGSAIVDPFSRQTTALVVKLNPQASGYLYVRYLGGSVADNATAIAVDSAGNAYIAGETRSPDFPVTAGGNLGTPATGPNDPRCFVTKLDSAGNMVFSHLLGGVLCTAQAVGVTAGGQAVVSGFSYRPGFPTTPGAYSVSNSSYQPYLLELNAAGTNLVFSATGVGGNAIAVDTSGNIYVAGTTGRLDYPTTPGAFQTTFPAFYFCAPPCEQPLQGANQYVSKIDPTGSTLIYSTALTGTSGTMNAGLAVDQAGNVYVTGFAGTGYPYTVTAPDISQIPGTNEIPALPFLSKLDPAGRNLLFSVPVGGAGVQVDSAGSVYVGGRVGSLPAFVGHFAVTTPLPVLAGVPAQCLPNTIRNSAYISQADASSGTILGTQFIGGTDLNPSAVALVGSTLWIAGATDNAHVPFTPNALLTDVNENIPANQGAGAYLGAVDFSQPAPPAGAPQIECVTDDAEFSLVGPVARLELLSIFGTGLGPEVGVNATDNSTTSLAGVSLNFGNTPATLLYVSATQVNFAVPAVSTVGPVTVTVNGVSSTPREFPITDADPHFFMYSFNADGSLNALGNPAQAGSVVSVFLNGVEQLSPEDIGLPPQFFAIDGWTVKNITQFTPFVVRVDVQAPSVFCGVEAPACPRGLNLFYPGVPFMQAGLGAIVYIEGRSSP